MCIAFRPKPGLEFVSPGLSPVLRYPASGASLLQGGVARDTQLWRRAHAKNSLPVMGPGEITDPESIESRTPPSCSPGLSFFDRFLDEVWVQPLACKARVEKPRTGD